MAEIPSVRLCRLALAVQPVPEPFDFQAWPDQMWMLVGTVDSGRRQLIRTIAGLTPPQSGRVELFGQPAERLWPRANARLRRRIGVVLEQAGLAPAWSVFENLALLVRYHGLAPASDVERYVVEFVEICRAPPTLLSRLAGDLSPLESSWVGLLRALIIRPELLLVSGYLPRETLVADYGVWRFFEEVVQPMRMTILVDAGPQALPIHPESRLLVMNQGTLLAAGLASELRDHPDARVQRYARADHA